MPQKNDYIIVLNTDNLENLPGKTGKDFREVARKEIPENNQKYFDAFHAELKQSGLDTRIDVLNEYKFLAMALIRAEKADADVIKNFSSVKMIEEEKLMYITKPPRPSL